MTIVHDPGLGIGPSGSEGVGTFRFMAPELLNPGEFGPEGGTPSKEADIYATGMTIYQVRAGRCPTHTLTNSSRIGTRRNVAVR